MSDDNSNQLPVRVETVMDDQSDDFTVVASSPAEMQGAQRSLILWAQRKIVGERELLKEAQEQHDIAKRNKWSPAGWARRISLSEGKIEYYKKIKMALEAGYYIVPPFPIEVFAVRTTAKKPTVRTGWRDRDFARAQGIPHDALPAGEGDYIGNQVATRTFMGSREDNKSSVYHQPYKFQAVEFPFKLAKSAVMSETARAMALKVFDQLGIMGTVDRPAQAAVPDPIVCGQILPWFHKRQPVTFFVAWWLDTKTL